MHNGSSLFTGDAGQGESNIRRWIIENDWLEAIVALPLNMFYNTGIATYIWVLTNRKPEHRKGRVQLIDATKWFQPLRKNLGKKNCELGEDDIARICDTFLAFEETEQSNIFDNAAFGYWKVTVDRPLRIVGADPNRAYKAAEIKALKESGERSEDVPPVIRKIHKRGTAADALRGLFAATVNGRPAVVEYEPDTDLRDTEQIPLPEEGGIEAFLRREVLPYAADAWFQPGSTKVGYEISFTRYFYKPKPMRTLEEIRADILALEQETEGLLDGLLVREPRAAYGRLRIYADTSVIGGCEDEEFREASRRLFDRFQEGTAVLVLSEVTLRELADAPPAVRAIMGEVPPAHRELVSESDDARTLAQAYADAGAVRASSQADALHVALATLAGADVLASWNFKHMVNWRRIEVYNDVNLAKGHSRIDIRTPQELHDDH